MPTLFAASFEGPSRPAFDVRCLRAGQALPDGWGIGFYPHGELSACVIKEASAGGATPRAEVVKTWDHLVSSIFMVQLRSATWGPLADANTQPFTRSYSRRDWLFAHAGSLDVRFDVREAAHFEPIGSTDSEPAFCELMERFAEKGWRTLGDADLEVVQEWYEDLSRFGDLSSTLSDGRDLLLFGGHGVERLFIATVLPPRNELTFGDDALEVNLTARGPIVRKGIVVASDPLETTEGDPMEFRALEPGELLVIREGAIRERLSPGARQNGSHSSARRVVKRPPRAEPRMYAIRHRTTYKYANPVRRSSHLLRLEPADDRLQRLLEYSLQVSVEGRSTDYEDVFGNRTRRIHVELPFSEFVVESRSVVKLFDTEPLTLDRIHQSTSIPLVWMPWQREVLHPFLLPEELPETQLQELTDYAMSFVRRNSFDLLDTLLDLNESIYREYRYQQGLTSVHTTPFEVYTERAGVCQDFANLFICLARLLGVPARYACGYLYVPPGEDNQLQSLASHAWVQVYFPDAGWRGFDPTNGVLTQTGHVRVAVGRKFLDATPTSGTLFEGGGRETLSVDVRLELLED